MFAVHKCLKTGSCRQRLSDCTVGVCISSIHRPSLPFTEYLLTMYYVPGIVLGAEDLRMSLFLKKAQSLMGQGRGWNVNMKL